MIYVWRSPRELEPFDDMVRVDPASGHVLVAIPATEQDAIGNLFGAGLIDGLDPVISVTDTVFDNPSHVT